ncbi:hypothetical protein [Enteractinococcus helveticum]|uniref:hypothetical protein n=1 Tax=Enteractinococcus helveticum TaxID=1837282 RepID=UPI0005BD3692|nr:hypothetical protein [Enteractinococcus helveticum]
MPDHKGTPRIASGVEAASRGISSLMRSVEQGEDLHDGILLLSRLARDSGQRTDLDDAISSLGFDREELEAELRADLAAGRE